jgi:hypothetical protein
MDTAMSTKPLKIKNVRITIGPTNIIERIRTSKPSIKAKNG